MEKEIEVVKAKYKVAVWATGGVLLATAMRAVNAIPWVCDAEPGIVDALHIPLTSPVGALHPRRDGVPAF